MLSNHPQSTVTQQHDQDNNTRIKLICDITSMQWLCRFGFIRYVIENCIFGFYELEYRFNVYSDYELAETFARDIRGGHNSILHTK